MTSMSLQRDLVITLKRETLLNVGILSKLKPMSSDLSRLLKDNQLEKPTQNLFNHLAFYLVSNIDPLVTLPWPLYDTKTERTYRNELSLLISDYSNKGLLSPVMSSYLVNPGCYKVIVLMFQLSQFAVQRVLLTKMNRDSQKKLYNEMTEKYKTEKGIVFVENIEKKTQFMRSKFLNYLEKRDKSEKMAKKLRDHIAKMENKLKSSKAQEFINNIVDGYLKAYNLDEESKKEILEIKNVTNPASYFDKWLAELDDHITEMETNWDSKMTPFLQICQKTHQNTETLIARKTGEADKRTFTIEYNPKTDEICTEELEKQVNTQQKYILKNIVRDDRLNFPNLIRGYLVSICFILRNFEVGDEIYQFNEYLSVSRRNYRELVNAMRDVLERVMNAANKLEQPQETFNTTITPRVMSEILPLPDLTHLKMNEEFHSQILFDPLTPLNLTKHQFNLRKQKTTSFKKPVPKILLTPFKHGQIEDFSKSLISGRVSMYDKMNLMQNNYNLNLSVIPQARVNETIAECRSVFTKEQICRLLSTKKSSTKKFKRKTERQDIKIRKGRLFNESNISNESFSVFRSHSSPNLYENRGKRPQNNMPYRKLSTMRKDSPSLLEVSGIAALERDSNHSTPQGVLSLESSRKLIDTVSLPSMSINVTPTSDISSHSEVDLNKEIEFKAPQMLPKRRSKEKEEQPVLQQRKSRLPQLISKKTFENNVLHERKSQDFFEELTVLSLRRSREALEEEKLFVSRKSQEQIADNVSQEVINTTLTEAKVETPKTNPQIKQPSSLEKIINRFKKVRASVLPSESRDDNNEFKTIFEEKENLNSVNVDVFTSNRNLLPDLLSPSYNIITPKSNEDILVSLNFDSDDEEKFDKPKKRESLGAALGVDNTFLDQFELID